MLPHRPLSTLMMLLLPIFFGELQGVSQNKRLSLPREKLGHTPARKKHGGTASRASSVKVRRAIQELLPALHDDNSFDRCAKSLDLHRPMVTPHGKDGDNADGGHNKGNLSDDNNYHPTSIFSPPPSRLSAQKKKEPKIVLDRTFMTFLCPSTLINHSERVSLQNILMKRLMLLTTTLGSNCMSTSQQQGCGRSSWTLLPPLEQVDSATWILMSSPKTTRQFFQQNGTSCPFTFWRTYLIASLGVNSLYVLLLMAVIWSAENITPIKQIQLPKS
jgi:hypothetical protein